MKITDYKNEEALELLCNLLDPISRIFSDKELAKALVDKCTKIEAVKIAIRNHKSDVIEALAVMKGVPKEEYSASLPTMMAEIFEILNDKELLDFFSSQGLIMGEKSSTQPMANTKAKKK